MNKNTSTAAATTKEARALTRYATRQHAEHVTLDDWCKTCQRIKHDRMYADWKAAR